MQISKTELQTRYQGAAFGMAWSVAEPLLIFGVMYAVFSTVARFGGAVPHYPAMLLMNIMLYRGIFASSTARATTGVVARENIVRKTQFPRIIIPLSVVCTTGVLFIADAIVLLVLPARQRRASDGDLAAVPGHRPGVPDPHGGDVAAPVEPLRPLSRHGADLERHLADLLLRLAR